MNNLELNQINNKNQFNYNHEMLEKNIYIKNDASNDGNGILNYFL